MRFNYANKNSLFAKARVEVLIPEPLWKFAERALPGQTHQERRRQVLQLALKANGVLGDWYYDSTGLRYDEHEGAYENAIEIYRGPEPIIQF